MSVMSLFDLHGKVALITGGSRGLGLQMAHALGEAGAKLALVARKPDELASAKAELEAKGFTAKIYPADLSKRAVIAPLVDAVMKDYGRIDVLLNNAGASWGAPAEDYPDEAWDKVMDLNITAMFMLTRAVARAAMIPQKSGAIINIASIAGLRGNPETMKTIAYNTSKGAVVNFTRALAAEWGHYGIRVNAILPGFFPSKMTAGLLADMKDMVIARTPLHRIGGDEDLMGAALLFASEASRHITGQCLAIDGGSTAI